jgi:hypothetical protein
MGERVDSRKISLERFDVLLLRGLDEFCCDNFEILEFGDFCIQDIVEDLILEQQRHQFLPLFDGFLIRKGLQQISPQHSGPSMRQAHEIIHKTVGFTFSLAIQEDL